MAHLELTQTKSMLCKTIAKGLNFDTFSLKKAKKKSSENIRALSI